MAAKQKPEFTAISPDLTNFNKLLDEVSQEKLVLVDVHQEWSGPTGAIMPFLNQLWVDLEDANSKIHLSSIALDEGNPANPALVKRLQQLVDPEIKVANQGCKPLFILLKGGLCVATVDGMATPALKMFLGLHLPKPQVKK
jgi:hypothetical protein